MSHDKNVVNCLRKITIQFAVLMNGVHTSWRIEELLCTLIKSCQNVLYLLGFSALFNVVCKKRPDVLCDVTMLFGPKSLLLYVKFRKVEYALDLYSYPLMIQCSWYYHVQGVWVCFASYTLLSIYPCSHSVVVLSRLHGTYSFLFGECTI